MSLRKSIKNLKSIYNSLKRRFEELETIPVENKESKFSLRSQKELSMLLNSNLSAHDKKVILLGEIVGLRINIFGKYQDQINHMENLKDYDKSINLMKECSKIVAIPFLVPMKKPSFFDRIKNFFITEEKINPLEYKREFGKKIHSWFNEDVSYYSKKHEEFAKYEKYLKIKEIYNIIWGCSFSLENNPPQPTIVFVDPNRVKLEY